MGDGQKWAAEQDELEAERNTKEEALRKFKYNGLLMPQDRQRYIEDHKEEYDRHFANLPAPGTMCFAHERSHFTFNSHMIGLWDPQVYTDSAYCGPWRSNHGEGWGTKVWHVRYPTDIAPSIEVPNLSFVMYVGPFYAIDLSPGIKPMVQVLYNDRLYLLKRNAIDPVPKHIMDCLRSPPDQQKAF